MCNAILTETHTEKSFASGGVNLNLKIRVEEEKATTSNIKFRTINNFLLKKN